MTSVEKLESFIDNSIKVSREHGYHPTTFIGMRQRHGTIGAINKLVVSGDIQSGFTRMRSLGLIDWTIEAAVMSHSGLFSNKVVEAAKWRLEQIS